MKLLIDGFEHRTTDTGEVEIGYSVGPDNGPPLLLLHGVTSRRDGFVRVVDSLTPSWRVVAMDQRGHGFSGHAPGAYGRADHARDIRHVLDNVCGAPTIVWGHSMGGGNAVEMAAADGSLVRALMLEDPALFGASRPPGDADSPTRVAFRRFLAMIEEGKSVDAMAAALLAQNPGQPAFFARWKAECLQQMDAEILRNVVAGRSGSASDPGDLLARIDCPVLLVQADPAAGGVLPDDYLDAIRPRRDGFAVARLAGAGHNLNREHPEELLAVVLPWLEVLG